MIDRVVESKTVIVPLRCTTKVTLLGATPPFVAAVYGEHGGYTPMCMLNSCFSLAAYLGPTSIFNLLLCFFFFFFLFLFCSSFSCSVLVLRPCVFAGAVIVQPKQTEEALQQRLRPARITARRRSGRGQMCFGASSFEFCFCFLVFFFFSFSSFLFFLGGGLGEAKRNSSMCFVVRRGGDCFETPNSVVAT